MYKYKAYVESIYDGDTAYFTPGFLGEDRVRFIGIDTPEIKDPDKPIQRFGLEASHETKNILSGSERVCLITDSEGDAYDVYDRKLAYIFTEEGLDVNVALLKGGFAKGYLYFPFSRKEEFRVYHEEAKEAGVGLWAK